jgi:hypothetical protein
MRQLDFKVTQGAGETRLCAAGGVPPIIVGLSEGLQSATYSNYGMARRKFGDHWGIPQWKSFAHAAGTVVDPAPGPNLRLGVNTAGIAFLREDAKDAAEIAQIQASTLVSLLQGGIKFDSAKKAVVSGDMSLTEWSGYLSVQLQQPGGPPPPAGGPPVPDVAPKPAAASGRRHSVEGEEGAARLHEYWTRGEGLTKWADSPKPWTTLRDHLLKYLPAGEAERTAAEWFHDVFHFWPGSDENRVTHGHPPRGHVVGPG